MRVTSALRTGAQTQQCATHCACASSGCSHGGEDGLRRRGSKVISSMLLESSRGLRRFEDALDGGSDSRINPCL